MIPIFNPDVANLLEMSLSELRLHNFNLSDFYFQKAMRTLDERTEMFLAGIEATSRGVSDAYPTAETVAAW